MNKVFSQAERQGRLTTVLGNTALVLLRMDGTEEMSGDFEWSVEALAGNSDVDLHALLGTHATVEVDHATGTRSFDGIVCEAEARGGFENGWRYDLVLRPWLHVAGLRRNMRIFHNKTVVEIAKEVLTSYASMGEPHLAIELTTDYPVLEYTVQYNESDADFVRRQLERHGISWSWRHSNGSHTLLLTDTDFSLPEVPGGSRPFYGVDGYHRHEEEHFHLWASAQRITTGAVRLTEYNFKTPNAAQNTDHLGDASHVEGDIESYDWPGDYLEQDEGNHVVKRRLEEERGQAPRHTAQGDVASLGAGWRVTLSGEEMPGATGKTFICLKAEHRFRSQAYGSGDAKTDDTPYEGSYVLTPDDTPYRPERRQKGTKVLGPETAVVVGDGEIDCDKYGRILVRFHWDDAAANTMRVRVSQNWASKGWGGMVIPRVGMEVIVEHLRGDPDKPIVTGCVYNGANDTPYPLPEHKTKSVFRSDSHESEGFNEFTFEDATGAENISLHAQKDQTLKVLNDRSKRVDHDQIESVGNNKSIDIGNNHAEKIGGSMNLSVGSGAGMALFAGLAGLMSTSSAAMKNAANESGDSFVAQVTQSMSKMSVAAEAISLPINKGFKNAGEHRQIAGLAQVNAGAAVGVLVDQIMPIGGIKNTIVEKATIDTIGLARTEQVGLMKNTFVGKVQNTVVGEKKNVEVGEISTTTVGKHMEINVGDDLIITVGKSRLTMTKEGTIILKGVKIEIEADKQIRAQSKLIDLN